MKTNEQTVPSVDGQNRQRIFEVTFERLAEAMNLPGNCEIVDAQCDLRDLGKDRLLLRICCDDFEEVREMGVCPKDTMTYELVSIPAGGSPELYYHATMFVGWGHAEAHRNPMPMYPPFPPTR